MYIYNVDKEGCVKVPAILSLKNGQKYKLLSAEDISWNVTLKDKDNTIINTTDDLLDYITGISEGGDDSPVGPERFTVYYILCDVTVCYEGTVFDHSPEIKVFKNTGYDITEVTYQYLEDHGMYVRITCSADTNDQLIIFDYDQQCLNGIAKQGIYTLELLQGEGSLVAAYNLTVLKKPTLSNVVIVYTQQETRPAKPEGGSYDFENKQLTPPEGWSDDILDFQAGGSIWFSVGTMYSNSSPVWSSPSLYITESSFEPKYENRSIGVSVYTCIPNNSSFVAPNTPVGGLFDTTSQTIICPNHWYITPEEAIEAYKLNAQEEYIDRFVTYVSFNNYILKYEKTSGDIVSVDETGWTTPSKYLNIAQILDDAKTNANAIVSDAITNANKDLQDALDSLINDFNDLDNDVDGLSALVKTLNDNYGLFSQISAIIDSITVLYNWERCLQSDVDTSKLIQLTQEQYDSITADNIQNILSGPDYFDKYVILKDGQYYHYTATSASLINLIAALRKELDDANNSIITLSDSVSEITPDYIRLQSSTGYLSDVTWTLVSEIPSDAIQHVVNSLPTTEFVYGDYYIVDDNKYRCDYPISTGLLKILSDKITLAVTRTTNGNTISSTINMTVGDDGSKIEATADDIVLNGDVIAAAIASKELNIDDYTYLYSKEQAGENGPMAIFGGNTSGTTIFNADGSGQLGGGNLTWNNTGDVIVTGTINASAGQIGEGDNAWFIGTIGPEITPIPAIYSKDTDGYKIILSTERLEGGLEAIPSWVILKDGTATFANGNVIFNNDGTGRIGSDETNITINENGDISLVGINISLSSEKETLIINDAANKATGIIINDIGTNIIGQLNTEDISIGNGSCFFDGTGEDAGAGYVANGAISWDENGKLTIKGNYDIKGSTSEYGNSCIYKLHELNPSIQDGDAYGDLQRPSTVGQYRRDIGDFHKHSFYVPGSGDFLIYNIPMYNIDYTKSSVGNENITLRLDTPKKADNTQFGKSVIRDMSNFIYERIEFYNYLDRPLTSRMFRDYFNEDYEEEWNNHTYVPTGHVNVYANSVSIENGEIGLQESFNNSIALKSGSNKNGVISVPILDNGENNLRHNDVYTLFNEDHMDLLSNIDSKNHMLRMENVYGNIPWFRNERYVKIIENKNNKYFLPDPEEYRGRTFDITIRINSNTKDLFVNSLCGKNDYIYESLSYNEHSTLEPAKHTTEIGFQFNENNIEDYYKSYFVGPTGSLGENLPYIAINAKNSNNQWIKYMGCTEDSVCNFGIDEDKNYYYIGERAFASNNPYYKALEYNNSVLLRIMKAYNIPMFTYDMTSSETDTKYYKLTPIDYTLTPYPTNDSTNNGKCVCLFDRYLGTPKTDPQNQTVLMGYDSTTANGFSLSFENNEYTLDGIVTYNTKYVIDKRGLYPQNIVYTQEDLRKDITDSNHGGLYLCLSPIALNKIGNGKDTNLKLTATAKEFKPGIYGWVINSIDFIPTFKFFCYPLPSVCFKDVTYKFKKYHDTTTEKDSTDMFVQYEEWNNKSFNEKIYRKLNDNIGLSYDEIEKFK